MTTQAEAPTLVTITEAAAAKAKALLEAAGAPIIEGPVTREGGRSLSSASGTSLYTRDPDNNLLELIVY